MSNISNMQKVTVRNILKPVTSLSKNMDRLKLKRHNMLLKLDAEIENCEKEIDKLRDIALAYVPESKELFPEFFDEEPVKDVDECPLEEEDEMRDIEDLAASF